MSNLEEFKSFPSSPSGASGDGGVAPEQLKAFVERVERLEENKAAVTADIAAVYSEAKANGFDVKILRQVIRIRRQDRNQRLEMEALLELYLSALGMDRSGL